MERDGVTVFVFGRFNPVPSTQLCCRGLCLHQHLAVCKQADPGPRAPSRSTRSFCCLSLFAPLPLKAQVSRDKAAEVELQVSHWEGRSCSSHGWVFPACPCLSLPAHSPGPGAIPGQESCCSSGEPLLPCQPLGVAREGLITANPNCKPCVFLLLFLLQQYWARKYEGTNYQR